MIVMYKPALRKRASVCGSSWFGAGMVMRSCDQPGVETGAAKLEAHEEREGERMGEGKGKEERNEEKEEKV